MGVHWSFIAKKKKKNGAGFAFSSVGTAWDSSSEDNCQIHSLCKLYSSTDFNNVMPDISQLNIWLNIWSQQITPVEPREEFG